MKSVLITGGSGFFGSLLKQYLINEGFNCVNIDLEKDDDHFPNLISIQGDIRNKELLDSIFSQYKFDAIFHCAAILAHAVKDKNFLWTSNVDGTKNIAEAAKKFGITKIIFLSSNCLWGRDMQRLITETDVPEPIEIYGKSKLEGENILISYKDSINSVIIRCPTIIDSGRLGLLSILFEFIDEGRKVWVVGGGLNKYQFIFAGDLIDACVKSLKYESTEVFNIGSDNVKSFKEVYQYVINEAKTGAKVAALPKKLTLAGMKFAYLLGISPLGPYQYKMISADFVFDTTKIKQKLNWSPTLTNEQMLFKAYEYYSTNKNEIKNRKGVSAHKQSAKMGIIKLLKWLS